jgi:hypothetical protein
MFEELRNTDYDVSEMSLLEICTLLDEMVKADPIHYDLDKEGQWEERMDEKLWKALEAEYASRTDDSDGKPVYGYHITDPI